MLHCPGAVRPSGEHHRKQPLINFAPFGPVPKFRSLLAACSVASGRGRRTEHRQPQSHCRAFTEILNAMAVVLSIRDGTLDRLLHRLAQTANC